MSEIKIVRSWDSMPPVLYDGDEAYSTRVLERKYRKMEEALESLSVWVSTSDFKDSDVRMFALEALNHKEG